MAPPFHSHGILPWAPFHSGSVDHQGGWETSNSTRVPSFLCIDSSSPRQEANFNAKSTYPSFCREDNDVSALPVPSVPATWTGLLLCPSPQQSVRWTLTHMMLAILVTVPGHCDGVTGQPPVCLSPNPWPTLSHGELIVFQHTWANMKPGSIERYPECKAFQRSAESVYLQVKKNLMGIMTLDFLWLNPSHTRALPSICRLKAWLIPPLSVKIPLSFTIIWMVVIQNKK